MRKNIKKQFGLYKTLLFIAIFIAGMALSSCAAKKHHKAVPCPCEKNKH